METWQWALGVNLWGVIHGIRTFVPIMLRQDTEGHIVNTASLAGVTSLPFFSVHDATKHAIVTLSESLHLELAMHNTKVKVSVLCPGGVQTPIMDYGRSYRYFARATPARWQKNSAGSWVPSWRGRNDGQPVAPTRVVQPRRLATAAALTDRVHALRTGSAAGRIGRRTSLRQLATGRSAPGLWSGDGLRVSGLGGRGLPCASSRLTGHSAGIHYKGSCTFSALTSLWYTPLRARR